MARVTLALSGGGAAGFGHIPVLEALDDLGVRPVAIAGASVGALVGAVYAAGLSGAEIRAHVTELVRSPTRTARRLWKDLDVRGITSLLAAEPRAVLDVVLPQGMAGTFEALGTPLVATATDYHARKSVAFSSGPLRDALAASIAIPGVFRPVTLGGRVYVDGGVTNNLPLDLLPEADLPVAVDVASEPPSEATEVPGGLAASVGAMRIMMRALVLRTLEHWPPAVLIEPGSRAFGALEFWRADEILEAAAPAYEETKRAVGTALDRAGA